MNIQTICEQILFGTRLTDKFTDSKKVSFASHKPLSTVNAPGRPHFLTLGKKKQSQPFPSASQLESKPELRGYVFHAFANHELLAIELMALCLLKFPNAPLAFREGVWQTIQDEQRHLRTYIKAMKTHKVEFGDFSVSDFFWNHLSKMDSPLHYVSGMGLTFEQANLDFSKQYLGIFENIQDKEGAKILREVYQDEIRHVRFGHTWFKSWSGKDEWETYRNSLSFPITPARAKGHIFDKQARVRAGMSEHLINQIYLFSHSKGRTPHVYYFNPEAEESLKGGGIAPISHTLKKELAFLPFVFAREGDILVLDEQPSIDFIQKLKGNGFHIPEMVLAADMETLHRRRLREWRPWSQVMRPKFISTLTKHFCDLPEYTSASLRKWHSKSKLFSDLPDHLFKSSKETDSQEIKDEESFLTNMSKLKQWGYTKAMCKKLFEQSGRGNKVIEIGDQKRPFKEPFLVEPYHVRVLDLSFHFEKKEFESKLLGSTRFFNSAQGQFQGVYLGNAFDHLPVDLLKEMHTETTWPLFQKKEIHQLKDHLHTFLEGYRGPFSIDSYFFRDLSGKLKFRPLVELNPRYTMGRVGLELKRHTSNQSVGFFGIGTPKKKYESLRCFQEVKKQSGKLAIGVQSLSPFSSASAFSAQIWVHTDHSKIQDFLKINHLV